MFDLINTGTPFKMMTDQELQDEIRKLVANITMITGCHVEPNIFKATLTTIKQFIFTNFGFLTLAEVIEAFQMNSAGQLPERVEHYNRSLNCDYIGKVLSQFKDYRAPLLESIFDAVHRVKLETEDKPKVEVVTDADRREMLEIAFQMHRRAPSAELIGASTLFDYAAKFNLLSGDVEHLLEKSRARLIARVGSRLAGLRAVDKEGKRVGERVELERLHNELSSGKEVSRGTFEYITTAAKEISIRELFSSMVANGREVIFVTSD